ncbi:O-antigen ligase [Nocardioides alpinus]|uniref:O-antigen ligase n=1 Tax=Nocardioides alpinus TaxID=748909 RepID=A0A1I0WHV3_9ACTN|nr:O-antigen ligase family protein [Nocardioides alpinus]PKH37925.1 hypothetical protein CXG46_21320 [Nocardioides alpinus]SFA87967.1 O-antigen ligase [Nocardioides alpinus]
MSDLWVRLRSRPEPPGSPSGVVWAFAIAAVFFFMSNPLTMVPFFGDSLHRSILVAVGATVLTLPWIRLPRIPWAVLPVVALMYASLAWTISWDVTWGVSMVYVKIALVAWLCSWSTDLRTIAHGLHLGGVAVVIGSIYAYWAGLPFADVPDGAKGFLAGVGANRNILGYTLALAWAAALAHHPQGRRARLLWSAGIATLALGLVLAQSATAFVCAALVAALAFASTRRHRLPQRLRGRTVLALALGTVVAAVVALPLIGVLLGRDSATLSGRTQVWTAIWNATYGQRLLGQGWGTTWPHAWVQAPPNPVFEYINANYGAGVVAHGHNSLIDVMPDLGFVGMGAFALAYVVLVLEAVRRWWLTPLHSEDRDVWATLTVLLAAALIVYGINEPLATTPLGWFLLVVLSSSRQRRPVPAVTSPEQGEGRGRAEAHGVATHRRHVRR